MLNYYLICKTYAVNRFQILGEEQEMNIDSFNQAFKEVGEKVLGFKKKRDEWR